MLSKDRMSIIIVGRKLQPYFSGSQNPRKNQLPYLTSPKKLDMAGRMVSWAVELSECDIQYVPRGSIISQALVNFLVEFSLPVEEETQT